MSDYANRKKAPKTLTDVEQRAILRVSGEHRDGFRDHVIFSIALGTALREHEILALNVGDVFDSEGAPRTRFELSVFKGSASGRRDDQEAFVPEALRYKLKKFYRWKATNKEPLADDAPLFLSREGSRLSTRRLRAAFAEWQERARLDRHYNFHCLRHTALTNLYRASRDIRLVQRVARHANLNTTSIYAAPSDEDVSRAIRDLRC